MAKTNKYFDDEAILDQLKKSHGIDVSGATDALVDLAYEPPMSNGVPMVKVTVEFYVWLSADEADAALRQSLESSSGR